MRSGLLWFLILFAGVAGFFLGRGVDGSASERTGRAGDERDARVPRERHEAVLVELERERETRRRLADELKRTRGELAAARASAPPDADRGEEGTDGEVSGPDPARPVFVFEGMEEALAQIDWDAVGRSGAKLPPLLEKLAAALLAGESPPPEAGEIQRWNGPLVTEALKAVRAGIEGTGVNGSFSHPAMTVNLVAAALRRTDAPLSKSQAAALEELGRRYAAEENARQAGYADDTPRLQRALEEAALKQRLAVELEKVLGPGQMSRLRPEKVRGYAMVDIFSPGIMLGPTTRPVVFESRDQLRRNAADQFARHLELDDQARPALEVAVRTWTEKLDADFLSVKQTPLHRTDRIVEAGKRQLELQRAILATVPLSDAQRRKLLDNPLIFVPYAR